MLPVIACSDNRFIFFLMLTGQQWGRPGGCSAAQHQATTPRCRLGVCTWCTTQLLQSVAVCSAACMGCIKPCSGHALRATWLCAVVITHLGQAAVKCVLCKRERAHPKRPLLYGKSHNELPAVLDSLPWALDWNTTLMCAARGPKALQLAFCSRDPAQCTALHGQWAPFMHGVAADDGSGRLHRTQARSN